MSGVKTMDGKSKISVNGSVIDLNFKIELVFSYVWEALMDASQREQRFLSRLERISPEAKEEYLKIKEASFPGTEEVLEAKDQDCDTTKASCERPPTHAASEFSTRRLFKASLLFLLGKKIISENCKRIDVNVAELVLSYVLEALMDTPQGKERVFSCLKRISQGKYLYAEGASIPKGEMVNEDKAYDHGATRAIKSSDSINKIKVRELVYSYQREDLFDTPQKEKRFLSRLRRISREAKEEYLNIKAENTTKTGGLLEDNTQDRDTTKAPCHAASASASSTSKKPKISFEHICGLLLPNYKLPEGLLLAQSIFCAKAALAFYNNEHGTEYKLVEPLASARHFDCGVRFHSNFTAAKAHTSQPKLFYADFQLRKKVHKMHCCIIDSAKATFMCCGDNCSPDLAHCDQRSTRYLPCCHSFVLPMKLKAKKDKFCAKTALDFYNAEHGTTYKLVRSLESNIVPLSFGVYKFNCNFVAKLENRGSSNVASAKHFFGEFVCSTHNKDGVCCILETAEGLDDDT